MLVIIFFHMPRKARCDPFKWHIGTPRSHTDLKTLSVVVWHEATPHGRNSKRWRCLYSLRNFISVQPTMWWSLGWHLRRIYFYSHSNIFSPIIKKIHYWLCVIAFLFQSFKKPGCQKPCFTIQSKEGLKITNLFGGSKHLSKKSDIPIINKMYRCDATLTQAQKSTAVIG